MNIALKEWAAVVSALAEGSQDILLRKGGIVESKRGFELRYTRFLLLPGYEHQQTELVRPEFQHLVVADPDPAVISISLLAEVTGIQQLNGGKRPASKRHIYSNAFLEMREQYRPDLPLYEVSIRIWKMPKPQVIPYRAAYDGCKSWVNLTDEIDIGE